MTIKTPPILEGRRQVLWGILLGGTGNVSWSLLRLVTECGGQPLCICCFIIKKNKIIFYSPPPCVCVVCMCGCVHVHASDQSTASM